MWELLKEDVLAFVYEFFETGFIAIGCNASFVTLIPKVENPVAIKDYHPISLIGLQYKIIAKLLTNRLVKVISSVISMEQSAFVKGRQILDGPLMVNEIISWCKRRRKRIMIFKVDFEKAFNSASWAFLDKMMFLWGFLINGAVGSGLAYLRLDRRY